VSRKRLRKNLNSDDHFDRSFSFMAMKGKSRTQPQQQLEQKYENSKRNKPNSPLAFLACSTPRRTSAGYHRCVDSCAGPRNARLRACQPNAGAGPLSVWLARLDVQRV
jgi:hypothetical protein